MVSILPLQLVAIVLMEIGGGLGSGPVFPGPSAHPLLSNWTIKLLVSQGIFITPLPSFYYADSFLIASVTWNTTTTGSQSQSQSQPKLVPPILYEHVLWKPPIIDIDHSPKNTMVPRDKVIPLRFQYSFDQILPTIEAEARRRGKVLSIPPQASVYHSFPLVETLHEDKEEGKTTLTLKFYVKDMDSDIQLVRLNVVETFHPSLPSMETDWKKYDWFCASDLFDFEAGLTSRIAIVRNGTVYQIPHRLQYLYSSEVDCQFRICLISKRILNLKSEMSPEPCLTHIYQNKTIRKIKAECSLSCAKLEPSRNRNRRDVRFAEVGDRLYVSRAFAPIHRICDNLSLNVIINPPTIGSLEMKLPCGCTLHYQGEMVWSRAASEPPLCTRDPNETLSIYQVLQGQFMEFENETTAEIESMIFLNFSGNIVSKKLFEAAVLEAKAEVNANSNANVSTFSWSTFCIQVLIALLLILAHEWYKHKCRCRRNYENLALLQQQAQAQLVFIHPFAVGKRRFG
jgi:hypothetical protein